MIVESSAIVAIFTAEPERYTSVRAIVKVASPIIPAQTLVETRLVLSGRRPAKVMEDLEMFLLDLQFEMRPFTAEHADAAHAAFLRFGKGRHPAGLNFGAWHTQSKGSGHAASFQRSDFALTDIGQAL